MYHLPPQLGKIGLAKADLDAAIELEPLMLKAYWHRHLILLLQNRKQQALDDLGFILKHKRDHAEAYKSR